jgi:hypothetical protein
MPLVNLVIALIAVGRARGLINHRRDLVIAVDGAVGPISNFRISRS